MRQCKTLPDILEQNLARFIREIAHEYGIVEFENNPDLQEARLSAWHQYGLLTHTKLARHMWKTKGQDHLIKAGVERVVATLDVQVGAFYKQELFEASILLHDLGKIPVYGEKRENRQHEDISGKLLEYRPIARILNLHDVNEEEKQYILRCITTHAVLGKKIRDRLVSLHEYTLDSIHTSNTRSLCKGVAEKYSDVQIELGLFYLCDSLAKTGIHIRANTDAELEGQRERVRQKLREENLPPELQAAVLQLPVNVLLAQTYLQEIVSHSS